MKKLVRVPDIEDYNGELFSAPTHPALEAAIKQVIEENASALPTETLRLLARETILYGFLQATGKYFQRPEGNSYPARRSLKKGVFYAIDGVFALSDFDGEVYIRCVDANTGYGLNSLHAPGGIETTLLNSGYTPSTIFVPHSTGELYADRHMEKLFVLFRCFSALSGNSGQIDGQTAAPGLVAETELPDQALYRARKPELPRISVPGNILIPGNRSVTVVVNSPYHR